MAVTIRMASAADAELLCDLSIKTFSETYERYNTAEDMQLYIQSHFTLSSILDDFQNPDIQYYLALMDDEAVGYAKLHKQHAVNGSNGLKQAELERIYVLSAYQGNKIGLLLLNECIQSARREGYGLLWLGVWENNTNAIDFYKKMGFKVDGSHSFILGKDIQNDCLMKLKL
ncbi:GNAT family N-acetyltransferase [Danxiaibacter flavus]|uniref:GNAT family N-acetyltransferase n=1 Tax=Danxiaibacter flavus TaxID=3049108 RepID=A0ABV3ZN63_9BACT|nr:GNAT family N-acetyltransferase [Chitinophagaceae bacterium DXS]